ncbi:BLUF domain-containing protein [Schumannella sp. 10F1B-5-1]|nr:BLUF domain-containing protein [Schumannella sp. 10F1B-5-1]
MTSSDLTALLEQSRAANRDRAITGMLLYDRGRFIQILEGPMDAVRDLLDRIREDPRHSGMRVLMDEVIDRRQFAEWSMGFLPAPDADGPPPEGFRDTFADLDAADGYATHRAARELSMWFRVRSGETATPARARVAAEPQG